MRENRQLTTTKNDEFYVMDALSRPVTRNGDTFAYNGRSELAEATIAGNHEAHAYDAIGNSTFAAVNSITNYYTANNLNQYTQIESHFTGTTGVPPVDESSFTGTTGVSPVADGVARTLPTYDADGNMTEYGPWTYTYDANSRLVTVSSNGILLVTNAYDAKGRRVRKVTAQGAHTYIYDDWNLIYERVDKVDGTTDEFHYVWGKDLSNTLQGAGGVGGLLYVKYNGTIYVPHTDAYGNITRYADTLGNAAAEYVYDAFGRTIAQAGSLANVFRHRFSTKYFDVETGLYYYGYRFYFSELKRWLTRDPEEEDKEYNMYCMAKNSPLVQFDYLGRFTCCDCSYSGNLLRSGESTGTSVIDCKKCFYLAEGWTITVVANYVCTPRYLGILGDCLNKTCKVSTKYRCTRFMSKKNPNNSSYNWAFVSDEVYPCSK